MSFEFFAALPAGINPVTADQIAAITDRLPLAFVRRSADRLSLRWTDSPLRTEWPEDIDISINPDGVFVSIHAGTNGQRVQLLSQLTDQIYCAIGTVVEFDEL